MRDLLRCAFANLPVRRLLVVVLLNTLAVGIAAAANAADSPASVDGAVTVDTAKAKALHDAGAVFFDVRSQRMWDAGRIPGAVFLPIEQFTKDAVAAEAGPGDDVVIYCQGLKCPRSAEAAVLAVSWGYGKVHYYREGYPGWKQAGYEIE
ncbi:MAG: rhodanese-like domain-containing protein [Rhodospirillales bacterium]|nr:rhodanese-like domain-containing protein [Rhodospirillales bacterium]